MPQVKTKKQFELKKKTERKNEIIKKVGSKINPGKIALKATPPGMMLTAAQKIKEEFNRLTKRKKKPEAKTGPVKKSKKVVRAGDVFIMGPGKKKKRRPVGDPRLRSSDVFSVGPGGKKKRKPAVPKKNTKKRKI